MKKYSQNDSDVAELLEILKPVPPRQPAVTARGRQQFLSKAQGIRQAVSISAEPRHTIWTNIFKLRKERLAMQILTSVLLIFAVLFGGAGGTVYASQSSMPDDLLYPVKLWSEDVRLDLTGDVTQELNLLDEFTGRRISEIQNGIEEGNPPTQAILDRLQDQTRLTLDLSADLPEDALVPTLLRLHDRLMEQDQLMQHIQLQDQTNSDMTQIQAQLQSQIRLVEDGLSSPVTFRQRLNNPNEDVPENTPGVLDTEKTPGNQSADKTPGPDNDNGNQKRNQVTATPEEIIDETESSEVTTLSDQSNGNQNGDGTCDGDCDGTYCQGDGDCDGDQVCDDCTGTNCQGTGDCDGDQVCDDCTGTNCQGTGDCDGTGKPEDTAPQMQATQKSDGSQGNKNK